MWRILDVLGHVLYQPLTLGRRYGRLRWYHHVHVIPGRLAGWLCDRFDLSLGATPEELRRK